MPERKKYIHISFDKAVAAWIQPLVESKSLGYESITEFIVQAVREKLDYYLQVGLHPWSSGIRAPSTKASKHGFGAGAALAVLAFGLLGALLYATGLTQVSAMVSHPLGGPLDFYAFYSQNWFLFDFLIYLTIFTSVAYVTVGRMFHHRGIAIGIGLLLAVAMASFEASAGFAIRDLGLLAATFFTLIMGSTLFHVFRKLHFGIFGAASTTLLLVYLAIIVMVPPFYLSLRRTIPFLDLLVFVGLIGCAIYATRTIVTTRSGLTPTSALEPLPPTAPELQAFYPELKVEQKVIQTYMARITTKAKKDCKELATELTYIYHVLTKFGDTPESRTLIAKKLKAMIPKEQDLDALLSALQQQVRGMQRLDYKILGVRKSLIDKLKATEKKRAIKKLKECIGKINAEAQLNQFERQVTSFKDGLISQVKQSVAALNQGDVNKAKQALLEAIKNANQAANILDEMKTFEELLKQVIAKELATLKPRK